MAVARGTRRSAIRDDYGVSVPAARWRARLALTVLVALTVVLVIGTGMLIGAHPNLEGLYAVGLLGSIPPVLILVQCKQRGESLVHRGPSGTVLTSLTWTGYRSVYLSRLVRIRYVMIPGKFGTALDMLVVTDARRVRVGITGGQSERALVNAINSGNRTIRISRGARRRLGMEPEPPLWRWVLIREFGTLALEIVWLLFVIAAMAAASSMVDGYW